MDNPEKLAKIGYTRQRKTKQNITPYVLDTNGQLFTLKGFVFISSEKIE